MDSSINHHIKNISDALSSLKDRKTEELTAIKLVHSRFEALVDEADYSNCNSDILNETTNYLFNYDKLIANYNYDKNYENIITTGSAFISNVVSQDLLVQSANTEFYAISFVENYMREDIANKLGIIDPVLESNYRQVFNSLDVAEHEPMRMAMLSCRQVFDTLFRIISPDDQVRASEYYNPKQDNDKIHRIERMTYAAHFHYSDELVKKTIISSIPLFQKAYDKLNALHSDKQLTETKYRSTISAFLSFLNLWISAIDV